MLFRDFELEAKDELAAAAGKIAKDKIKSRLVEIAKAKKVLAKLETQYQALLDTPVDEFVADIPSAEY